MTGTTATAGMPKTGWNSTKVGKPTIEGAPERAGMPQQWRQ
jgi:hypothetical protein